MVEVEFVMREDDGLGWYENGKIIINLRWIYEWDCEEEIISTFIHEYIEHELGLGHNVAVYVEKTVMRIMKSIKLCEGKLSGRKNNKDR